MNCIYFLWAETIQLRIAGLKFFKDPWNYIDIIPLCLMITITTWASYSAVTVKFYGASITANYKIDAVRDWIQSLTAILMWFKFAYFLRATEATGWLIRMIFEVIRDLVPFLSVLLISILAFTDAFQSMSSSQRSIAAAKGLTDPDAYGFTEGYTGSFIYSYLILIGEFGTDGYRFEGKYICWLYFLMATFFNLIVMLNLLIAIISDTYMRLQSVADALKYQTKAQIIADYLYLDDLSKAEQLLERDRMLLIAIETQKKDDIDSSVTFIDILKEMRKTKAE